MHWGSENSYLEDSCRRILGACNIKKWKYKNTIEKLLYFYVQVLNLTVHCTNTRKNIIIDRQFTDVRKIKVKSLCKMIKNSIKMSILSSQIKPNGTYTAVSMGLFINAMERDLLGGEPQEQVCLTTKARLVMFEV